MMGLTGEQIMAEQERIYAFVRSRLKHEQQGVAEDITLATIERAWRARDRFEDRGERAVSIWMYQIAANLVYSHTRRLKVLRFVSLEEEQVDAGRLDAGSNRQIDVMAVRDALPSVEPKLRAYLDLRLQGYRHLQAAAVLGLPKTTAHRRESAAFAAMREALGEDACHG